MKTLFDTKALVALFDDEKSADKVGALLDDVDDEKVDGFISTVTITELYYLCARKRDERFALDTINKLMASKLKIVPVSWDIALNAGKFKLNKIPLADALIAASAKAVEAMVVTDDPHFNELGVQVHRFR